MKRLVFLIFLVSFQLKAQNVDLIGGASVIRPRYTGNVFLVGRAGVSLNNVLVKKKLGFYALYEGAKWYKADFVDIIGFNYQISEKWHFYYGHSFFKNPTLKPNVWPISGRHDLGFSYKLDKIPLKVNVGWAFWNGPAASVSIGIWDSNKKSVVLDGDFDGVPDKKDKCPNTQAKYAKNVDEFGCPMDFDGDGVYDVDDSCRTEQGYNANEGCPDKDVDGIPDYKDNCPTVKGKIELKGCPEITEKKKDTLQSIKKLLDTAQLKEISENSKVRFDFGSASISEFEEEKIVRLAKFLKENVEFTIEIQGHADDIGSEEDNYQLSLRRANAYFAKLSNLGIYVARMVVVGKGELSPAVIGTTDQARLANRRVEIILKSPIK